MKHLQAKVYFRPAEPEDLKKNDRELRKGQAFLVLNTDNKTLSGFHIIQEETNPYEIANWLKMKRLYVPVSCLDQSIEVL